MTEVRWERMFPDQLEARAKACPVVYFAYGLCEPHGPHNVLGLDTLKAHAICCEAARTHGGIVAPPDYWHIHEIGLYASWAYQRVGEVRPWLTAVPPWVHFKNVCYHLRAADALGFHAAILLTGHYGPNWQDLKRICQVMQPHLPMRIHSLPDFEANTRGFTGDGKDSGDHAGKVETSLLWALEPDCVDMDRLTRSDKTGPNFAAGQNADEAHQGIGQRMVADEVEWLGNKARELLDAYQQNPPTARQPMSFNTLEKIWRDQIEPVVGEFESMKRDTEPVPPEDSVWRVNYEVP